MKYENIFAEIWEDEWEYDLSIHCCITEVTAYTVRDLYTLGIM